VPSRRDRANPFAQHRGRGSRPRRGRAR
jgi:hypothetical protein